MSVQHKSLLKKTILALLCLSTTGIPAMLSAAEQDDFTLNRIRGVVKAVDEATISSEIAARITKLPFRMGERFKKGAVLAGFDCSLYQAELASGKAELKARTKTYENKKKLLKLDAVGALDLELAAADVEKAKADVRMRSIWVRRCSIRAPYNGLVVERAVNRHESVAPDTQLMRIVGTTAPEVEVIVPSNWISRLKKGQQFGFRIDETGMRYDIVVDRIGVVVDAVSQTVKIVGRLKKYDPQVLPGMTGTAEFTWRQEG